jgi:hypothetical protein
MWEDTIKEEFSKPESVTSIHKHLSLIDENDPQVKQAMNKASLPMTTRKDQSLPPKMRKNGTRCE